MSTCKITPFVLSKIIYNGHTVATGEEKVIDKKPTCYFPNGAIFGSYAMMSSIITSSIITTDIETDHLIIDSGKSGIIGGRFYLGGTSGSYYVGSDGAGAFKSLTTDDGTVSKSDKKEKEHIKYLSEDNKIKDFIMSLQPVEYKWKDNGKRTHLGFYAQDVQQEALSTIGDTGLYCAAHYDKDDNGEPIDIGYAPDTPDEELSWGLRYTEFIAPMVSMIQMQQKQIDELQSQIQQLQERNEK